MHFISKIPICYFFFNIIASEDAHMKLCLSEIDNPTLEYL